MADYVIEKREVTNENDKNWQQIDPNCKFYDLELAFRVAKIIADISPLKVEYRVSRLEGFATHPIPSI